MDDALKQHLDLWEMKHYGIQFYCYSKQQYFQGWKMKNKCKKVFMTGMGKKDFYYPRKEHSKQVNLRSKVLIKPRDVCLHTYPKNKIFVVLGISNIITQNCKKDNYRPVNQAVPRIRIYHTVLYLVQINIRYCRKLRE